MPTNPLDNSNGPDSLESSLLLAQYQSLRSEIVGIVTARYQTIQITIIALGTAIAAGVQFSNPLIAMAYPVLAYILASTWATDERSIRRIAAYIADRIENPFNLKYEAFQPDQYRLDWETYMRSVRKTPRHRTPFTPSLGLFSISELTATAAGVFIFLSGAHLGPADDLIRWIEAITLNGDNVLFFVFLITDAICIFATFFSMASVSDFQLDK